MQIAGKVLWSLAYIGFHHYLLDLFLVSNLNPDDDTGPNKRFGVSQAHHVLFLFSCRLLAIDRLSIQLFKWLAPFLSLEGLMLKYANN